MAQTAKVMQFEPKKGINDVLKGARKKEDKKSSSPMMQVSDSQKHLAQEVYDLLTEASDLEAQLELKKQEVRDMAGPLIDEHIRNNGYISSVKIPTENGMTITVARSTAYIKCPPEAEDNIIDAIGDQKYQEYFNVKNEIKAKDDLSARMLQDLIDRIGADDFAKFFEVSTTIKPNERFHIDRLFKFSAEELEALDTAGVRAFRPAVKK